jgi:sugar O-acyltransferase (sialic acid O-acetyltransferase NeuD family)
VQKTDKLVLVGDSAFAEIAYEYFTHDSPYEVVAFSVDRAWMRKDTIFGKPVVPFEELERWYPPGEHAVYAASTYTKLNRLRTRFCDDAKRRGYRLASYVSSRAFVWRNVPIGEHAFIFEDNTIQPFVKIGRNVVLWSGNHIGHHSTIGDNVFISSHVVLSGFCGVGDNGFMGVNATVANNVTIGEDVLVGAGAIVLKDVPANTLIGSRATEPHPKKTARQFFGVDDATAPS